MREIKFRAYNTTTKRMSSWDVVRKYPIPVIEDESILMQYTGLKDSQGIDVFEGDILETFSKSRIEVRFYDGAFRSAGTEAPVIDAFLASKSTVIGNVYENPELLERKEDAIA